MVDVSVVRKLKVSETQFKGLGSGVRLAFTTSMKFYSLQISGSELGVAVHSHHLVPGRVGWRISSSSPA